MNTIIIIGPQIYRPVIFRQKKNWYTNRKTFMDHFVHTGRSK